MNLRRRVAITVGVIPAVLVLVFGAASLFLTARSLQEATDGELLQTANVFNSFVERGRGDGAHRPSFDDFEFDDIDFDGLEPRPSFPFLQALGSDGSMLADGGLVVTEAARAAATGDGTEPLFETIEVEGRSIRVLTLPTSAEGPIGAIQTGKDVSDIAEGLRRSRTATLLAGILAGLASAAIAWALSKRLVAPVRAIADAADRLRSDAYLPDRIDGEGVDDLGRLVTSFNQMLDELRHSRRQQQRLVADASHELRTPLTSLRVKTEFLQSQPDLPTEERQRLLDGAAAELASLSSLVTELVGLAADGAPSDEEPRLVDLAAIVSAEAERFRTSTGRQVSVSTTPGMVETRPQQVVRALSNLLINADKYTPTGQPIEVHQRGNRLEVRDHGPGIAEADRYRVFDRFYRGAGHQSIDGSGLGLAIVDSVATVNGGTTWIKTPDDGPGVIVGLSVGPSAAGSRDRGSADR